MLRIFFSILLFISTIPLFSQLGSIEKFLSDTSLIHASVSICVANADDGSIVTDYNSAKSLTPASVMKLITSATALEMLGPDYTFKTLIGYTGNFNKRSGKLTGNIVIMGGGDPALGSNNFSDYYGDFIEKWIAEIKKFGVRKISGRVLTDDSYFDFQPVPAKWLWEDIGNYYGAGVYGVSVFDNTYEIHFNTSSEKSIPVISNIVPEECRSEFRNFLVAEGTIDKGFLFSAPYNKNGWIAGSIPADKEDFILKASISDPPLLLAKMLNDKLEEKGISVSEDPSTCRLEQKNISDMFVPVTETSSPALSDIITVLNHESVNLYAEHLLKELGKKYKNSGSTAAGIEVEMEFLRNEGIKTEGMFIEDGSGNSPQDALSTLNIVNMLIYMKTKGKYSSEFYSSLPFAAREGTLKNIFTDPVFENNLKAKSGSMTRVKNYAGYFTTISGKNMAFSIIVNNFSGPSKNIITGIEEILKEIILTK